MKVTVDSDRCRGHGICLTLCSEVFALTDDGYAEVQVPEVLAEFAAPVRDAAAACPERAIEVTG